MNKHLVIKLAVKSGYTIIDEEYFLRCVDNKLKIKYVVIRWLNNYSFIEIGKNLNGDFVRISDDFPYIEMDFTCKDYIDIKYCITKL